jgi:ketosteroid isomerase-like protein
MKKPLLGLAIALLVGVGSLQGSRADAQSDDNAQIDAIYQKFGTALRHKDVNAIMSLYVRGNTLFVFDVSPPRDHVGWQSYYDDWKGFFASVKGGLTFKISELNVTVSGDVAYTRSIQSLAGDMGTLHALDVRVTDVLRKIDGKWLIVQEHVSVPVNFQTLKPDFTSRP